MSLSNFDVLAQNLLINFLHNATILNDNDNHQQNIDGKLIYNDNFVDDNVQDVYNSSSRLLFEAMPTAALFSEHQIQQQSITLNNRSIATNFDAIANLFQNTIGTSLSSSSSLSDYNDPLHLPDFIEPNDRNSGLVDGDSTVVDKLYLGHFIIAIILALVILTTVIGNLLVIAAILCERHLRSVGNYLVFSLAFADLMVACLVMPFGAIYVVTGKWTLGASLCDLWTVADVLCCTASILHLLAIALDRYWAVTNVDYIHQRRNGRRIGVMIFLIWFVSLIISVAPILGWRDQDFHQRIEHKQCLISQDVTYQIFATCASFYLPLLLILLLYWRIFQVARKRIRHKPGNKVSMVAMKSSKRTGLATGAGGSGGGQTITNVTVDNMNYNSASSVKRFKWNLRKNKLAKYSQAEYLQEHNRPASDIVSHNVDLCVDESINDDSADGDVSVHHVNVDQCKCANGHCAALVAGGQCSNIKIVHYDHQQKCPSNKNNHGPERSQRTTSLDSNQSSPISTPTEDMLNMKKLSITSTAKTTTTTTYLTMTESSTNQETANSPYKKDHQIIQNPDCSIIAEESSSSNSATQPLLIKSNNKNNNNIQNDNVENEIIINDDNDDCHSHAYAINKTSTMTVYLHDHMIDSDKSTTALMFDSNNHQSIMSSTATKAQQHNHSSSSISSTKWKTSTKSTHFTATVNDNSNSILSNNSIKHNCANIDCCSNQNGDDDGDLLIMPIEPYDRALVAAAATVFVSVPAAMTARRTNSQKGNKQSDVKPMIYDNDDDINIQIDFDARNHHHHDNKNVNDDVTVLDCPISSNDNINGPMVMMMMDSDTKPKQPNNDPLLTKCQQQQQQQQTTNKKLNCNKNYIMLTDKQKSIQQQRFDSNDYDYVPTQNNNHIEDDVTSFDASSPQLSSNMSTTGQQHQQPQPTSIGQQRLLLDNSSVTKSMTMMEEASSTTATALAPNHHCQIHINNNNNKKKKTESMANKTTATGPTLSNQQQQNKLAMHQKESVESKRERKAAKTLAIITGVFVICWLPFFINALLSPLSKAYQEAVPNFIIDFFLWLGYINSCVNPIIYTIFSPDFRTAFKKMLLGKKRVRSNNKAAWSSKGARV